MDLLPCGSGRRDERASQPSEFSVPQPRDRLRASPGRAGPAVTSREKSAARVPGSSPMRPACNVASRRASAVARGQQRMPAPERMSISRRTARSAAGGRLLQKLPFCHAYRDCPGNLASLSTADTSPRAPAVPAALSIGGDGIDVPGIVNHREPVRGRDVAVRGHPVPHDPLLQGPVHLRDLRAVGPPRGGLEIARLRVHRGADGPSPCPRVPVTRGAVRPEELSPPSRSAAFGAATEAGPPEGGRAEPAAGSPGPNAVLSDQLAEGTTDALPISSSRWAYRIPRATRTIRK